MSEKEGLATLEVYLKKIKGVVAQIDSVLKPIVGTFELRERMKRQAEQSPTIAKKKAKAKA